ncbi:MAG TPA: hypothetical protein VD757_02255, partial [Candidatus Nitrosocosmicus sp.]|nr:hypothetical protein [Candidatus Nitrosocosmicus sp.]
MTDNQKQQLLELIEQKSKTILGMSGISRAMLEKPIDEMKFSTTTIDAYADLKENRGIFISGQVGVGKTQFAIQVAKKIVADSMQVIQVSDPDDPYYVRTDPYIHRKVKYENVSRILTK